MTASPLYGRYRSTSHWMSVTADPRRGTCLCEALEAQERSGAPDAAADCSKWYKGRSAQNHLG
jgi:hypothetical protein